MSWLRTKFGQRLRNIRKQRDMTQENLAEAVQVSVEFISNMERGINAPSFETLERLGKSLNVKIMEFFRFEDKENT